MTARPDWIEALGEPKFATSFGNSDLAAQLVHTLLTDGSYRRHVDSLKVRLARAMGETAGRRGIAGLQLWTQPRGGLFLWAELSPELDAMAAPRAAADAGLLLAPANVFSVGRMAGGFLRFNVAQCSSPRVFEVLQRAMDQASKRAA